MDIIYALLNEVCLDCGWPLRWMWKRWSDEDYGVFLATGLCPRCSG